MTDTWGGNEYALMIFTKQGSQFSVSDLTGTWYGHALVSGNAGWETSTLVADSFGNIEVTWNDSYGYSGTDNATIGISSEGKIFVPDGPVVHGVMSLNKDFFVMVDTWDVNEFALIVYTKKGAEFSTSDLEGKWFGHSLISGNAGWETLTLRSNISGNIVVNWKESNGEEGIDEDTIGLSSEGLLTIANGSDVHGAMGINKNLIVITDTWDGNEYALTLLVKGIPKVFLSELNNNDDEDINLIDFHRVLKILTGTNPEPDFSQVKDVNGDNKTGIEESILTLQWLSD